MNIFNKNTFISVFNWLVLFIIGIFLTLSLRYSIVVRDDILDFIVKFDFCHGRVIPLLIEKFLIITLPNILNVPIQNFAFISEGMLKVVSSLFLVHIVSIAFFQYYKRNIILGLIYIPIFLVSIYYIFYLKAAIFYVANVWFVGYYLPIPIFLLFTYKIAEYYIKDKKKINKNEEFILILFAFIMPQLNEFVGITALCILIAFAGKLKILRKPLVAITFTFTCMLFLHGFWKMFDDRMNNMVFNYFSLQNIKDFIYACYRALITDNIVIWLFIIVLTGYILMKNRDKETFRFGKYLLVLLTSIFVFNILTYYLGISSEYDIPDSIGSVKKYWVTYFGVLFQLKMILIATVLYILGFGIYKAKSNNNIFNNILFHNILIIFLIINILISGKNVYIDFSDNGLYLGYDFKLNKQKLYTFDKVAVFNLKNNSIAIVPKDNAYVIFPDNIFPKNLDKDNFSREIYYNTEYLKYIQEEYHVDTSNGMSFATNEEAMNNFYYNGGNLTDEELNKLDFSVIKKL